MNKRTIATVLWFFMGWMVGAGLAFMVGVPTFVGGLLLAVSAAALIRMGPGRRVWSTGLPTVTRPDAKVVTGAPLATE